MFLKKRVLLECQRLFELMTDPAVFPFVRQKAHSQEEYLFLTKQMIEAEERSEVISRTIMDEWGEAIGTINLFDIEDGYGFLGTWIGKPYFGKGYNQAAKALFFDELFFEKNIETVYMKIRKTNIRSKKAAEKLPYVTLANETATELYAQINKDGAIFDLYAIPKDQYHLHTLRMPHDTMELVEEHQLKEA